MILIILEGKRQERRYGRSAGGSMMRTGVLELQRHLQPERKVEILLEKREPTVQAETGDKPEPGADRDGPASKA